MMKHICVTYFCLFIFNKCHVRLVLEIIYTHDHVDGDQKKACSLLCPFGYDLQGATAVTVPLILGMFCLAVLIGAGYFQPKS